MSTKIINVLRDDKLEDILDIFRATPAEEVVLVLPKKTRAFLAEDSFATLASESEELGKTILVLSESPEINSFAGKYNFGILASQKDEPDDESGVVPDTDITDDTQDIRIMDEDPEEEPAEDDLKEDDEPEVATPFAGASLAPEEREIISTDIETDAVLAVAPTSPRTMNDILGSNPDGSINIKISKKSERPVSVDVKRSNPKRFVSPEKTPLDEIQSVWQRTDFPKIVRSSVPSFKINLFFVGPLISRLSKKSLYFYGLIVIIIFGFVMYVSLGKAEIIVKPAGHPSNLNINVAVSDEFLEVSHQLKKIPGQLFSVEKKVEENFPATGEKDVVQKARGKITVFNEYGTNTQVLIATTRFESDGGIIFRTLKTITVPGTKVQNGKIIPGSIEVEVIADKAGDLYNIGSGKFTVPAFKEKGDLDRYGKFYGQSNESMRGGIIGKAKVVTEEDYLNAKKKVEERIVAEAEQELKTQASGLKILELPMPAVNNLASSAQIDEAVDSFTVSGVAMLRTVGFKESDLNDLLVQYIQSIDDVSVFPDKLSLKFQDVKFDDEARVLRFNVIVDGSVYSKIEQEKIIADLMGKNENEIRDYMKGIDSISSARVILSPFWVWRVPKDHNRIEMRFEYE
ncbi:MAG: hypothetical protein Q7S43_04385 [bacterium]|nr:hypothetical protein [bacterium]